MHPLGVERVGSWVVEEWRLVAAATPPENIRRDGAGVTAAAVIVAVREAAVTAVAVTPTTSRLDSCR